MEARGSQRKFIYLRQTEGGRESGYARVEAQDRAAKLSIVVQGFAPQSEAWVLALWQEGLQPIGQMRMDARGQGGTAVQLSAQELQETQMLLVARKGTGGVELPLAGTVGRGGKVDWTAVKRQAEAALHPAEEEVPPQQVKETLEAETSRAAEEEERDYDAVAEEPYEAEERRLRTPLPEEKRVELPALLKNAYWPQEWWPLHDLFERFEEVKPFAGEEDCAYIRIPLSGAYGAAEHYLLGARVKDGWVAEVGYLIPGLKEDAAAPVGYVWERGYWQRWEGGAGE